MLRPIIEIDEEKCNGCGQCIMDCAEGALAIVDGKARLISDVYCDGLGACLQCPQGALTLTTREAPAFDEKAAMAAKAARETGASPSKKPLQPLILSRNGDLQAKLRTWPLQLALMPAKASFLDGAKLLLSAHCAGFALPDIHNEWMQGRVPIIACPKLENNEMLAKKLAGILKENRIESIDALYMSVPCCSGLVRLTREALKLANKSEDCLHIHKVQL